MMGSFDTIAPVYDRQFNHAASGRMQRGAVWDYLAAESFFHSPLEMLDIHCGTGTDALWLAARGHKVTATDVSEAMLAEARGKERSGLPHPPVFLKQDLREKTWNWADASFDAILSNFAGLNCFDEPEMMDIGANIHRLLRPGGRFILVLFGKYCVIEALYYLAKGKLADAGRRASHRPTMANVHGEPVKTWYHSAKQVEKWMHGLHLRRKFAVGLFQPPSYLDEKFSRHDGLVRLSGRLERLAGRSSLFSNFGDHMLLDFEKA